MPLGWSMTLSRRIMAGVALGLTVILLLFGLVSRWTIHEATRAAYADRVELARMMASHVDHLLLSTLDLLQREAIGLGPALRQEDSVVAPHQGRLADLRLNVSGFAILSVTDATGTTVRTEPSQSDVIIGNPVLHPSVQRVLTTGRPQVTEFLTPGGGGRLLPCLAVPLLAEVEGQLEACKAKVVELTCQPFGTSSERTGRRAAERPEQARAEDEATTAGDGAHDGHEPPPTRRRGQQPGAAGHGRRRYDHLPTTEVVHQPGPDQLCCPSCEAAYERLPGEDQAVNVGTAGRTWV